jgi:hypothetical protein
MSRVTARDYLAIAVTSTFVERMFDGGRYVIGIRCSLNAILCSFTDNFVKRSNEMYSDQNLRKMNREAWFQMVNENIKFQLNKKEKYNTKKEIKSSNNKIRRN